jgi:UDP-glucose 4-epimerase
MSKCLVTGGAGFMGSHLARELLSNGHEVFIIDDLSGGFLSNVPEGSHFEEGSVVDHTLVNRIVEVNDIEYIFHFAAYAAEGLSHFIKRFNYLNNLIGSVNLINAAVNCNVRCFVFTSSIAVYGPGQVPMREEMIPTPEDSYGIAKYAVEMELKESHKMFGLNYIIFRPHNVYGENQNIGDRYRNVIGIFMNQVMQGDPMTIFGDGNQTRAFTYVDDVIPVIARSIEKTRAYNDVFNIGADIPYTVNYLAQVVARSMGVKPNIKHLEARKEVVNAFSSHEKVERTFEYKARTSLEEGVIRMAKWSKKVGPRKSKVFEEVEIMKNLPQSWGKDFGKK